MESTVIIFVIAVVLIVLRFVVFWRLEMLNMNVVRTQAKRPPSSEVTDVMSEAEYKKSLAYTLEKSKLNVLETFVGQLWLLGFLGWGVLGLWFAWVAEPLRALGAGVWSDSVYLYSFFVMYGLIGIPFSLYRTFNLEERYGFNTMTLKLYIKDAIKSLLISLVLMVPILAGVFWIYERLGSFWWLYGALFVIAFQFLMQILFPRFILPLFNKLQPLEAGTLRDEIFALAKKTEFQTNNILVMDGSKRSKHSNAFFAGIGKARRIVLFDTLVKQLTVTELKAVLAHEVGHYKRKHILKGMVFSIFGTMLMFYVLNLLVNTASFNQAFGLGGGEVAHTLILISLLSGTITFYLKPVFNAFSRKNEYEADAYAKAFTGSAPLISALKKLYKENLSNLNPHPVYSFFYYSHPTLREREKQLLAES
ncbi:STE24 endopeptidase [Spirochaetota bacterium]|nr:STE24 endopeptidase [Spirochaetota bacterium]